jgi:hypothetical protein
MVLTCKNVINKIAATPEEGTIMSAQLIGHSGRLRRPDVTVTATAVRELPGRPAERGEFVMEVSCHGHPPGWWITVERLAGR